MWLLREYAINIIVVSVLAIVFEMLLPATKQKKYVNVAIGLVVVIVIVSPLTKLPHYKEAFAIPYLRLDDYNSGNSLQSENLVAREFERRLAKTIQEEVFRELHAVIEATIAVNVNEEGNVVDIHSIYIKPFSEEVENYISHTFGISKDKLMEGG